jgi:hypothetical protein
MARGIRRSLGRLAYAVAVASALASVMLVGCGSSGSAPEPTLPAKLLAQARPIGHGARFHPPATGPVNGRCRRAPGKRFGVHVELFAADRVVLVAAGIGTRPPRTFNAGRISRARCYGDLVTLEPTGVVLVRRGAHPTLSDLFRSWGQPLSPQQLASFSAGPGRSVEVFVDGQRRRGSPGRVPLTAHSEIVLEVGPHVPPHASYTFPPGS